jgi:hypothetical protein
MSRRSTIKRRRERKRRRIEASKKALQLTRLRSISTANLIAEIRRRNEVLSAVFAGKD